MKIAIIGAGAMGSLLGFYLSKEAEVWLLDPWREHIDTINRDGLVCEREDTIQRAHPHATTDPTAIGPCDVVITLVKAHQTRWAAQQAKIVLHTDKVTRWQGYKEMGNESVTPSPHHSVTLSETLVVTLQNGVGNRELIAEVVGEECVTQGVTSLGATLLGPGKVRHAGHGATIFQASSYHKTTGTLADLFNACGLPASVEDDLDALVWGKLVVNVGINALTALLRVPNGVLTETSSGRLLMERAVNEAVAVAAARGTTLPFDDPLAHVVSVAQATSANRSSMLQDVLRSSLTEIATINGAVVKEGQRLGVPTPINELLTLLLQAIDQTTEWRV